MQAITYETFGTPKDVVYMTDCSLPEPASDAVRLRMRLSPVHNHDVLTISGEYGVKPALPAIPGSEAMGIIDALGDQVQGLKVGDRVAVAGVQGTWAEYFTAPATAVIPIPETVSDETAALLLAMPMSALMALNDLALKPGEWLAINAANGMVGMTLAQLAAARGIPSIGLVRSTSAERALQDRGFACVARTDTLDWLAQVRSTVGDGRIAGAIDMLGGQGMGDLLRLVDVDATVLSFGSMADATAQLDVADLIYKETRIRGFWAMRQLQRASAEQIRALQQELLNGAANGDLTLAVAQVFPLHRAAEAMHAYFQDRDGKILLSA
ncbi:MAG: zinc-binding dehydrogenase [Candidatus Competibacteraceae bacterium]|nr:zinc-binding dehydrogenase [Candidatus Competibacteraceae bacterium]